MKSQKEITIPVKDLISLLKKEVKLDLLECGGVDNWQGYSDSLYPDGEMDLNDMLKEIDDKYL